MRYSLSVFLVSISLSFSTFLISQELGAYEFTDDGPCPHNINTNVNVQPTNAVFSPFVSVGTSCFASLFQFSNSAWETGSVVNLNQYNEFSIQANSGFVLNLTSIMFGNMTNSPSLCNWHLRSSLDNFSSDIFVGQSFNNWEYPENFLNGFSNLNSITFRFYITDINNIDNDWRQDFVTINGSVTEVGGPSTWYADIDNDGFGDANTSEFAITSTLPNATLTAGDCNDNNNTIFPNAPEICDNLDNNCDGTNDEGLTYTLYYVDNDLDSYGSTFGLSYCAMPTFGFSASNDDCNDDDANIHPNVFDIPNNGIDEDCNGSDQTALEDLDGDGYFSDVDCDDSNASVFPNANEICDGIDNNCNGLTDENLSTIAYFIDFDLDGFGGGSAGDFCSDPGLGYTPNPGDCNDEDVNINPIIVDTPNNGIDENCDGVDAITLVDNDGDGFLNDVDCDDTDNTIFPGATEICDLIDNDCDGIVDDGLAMESYFLDNDLDNFGFGNSVSLCLNPGLGFALIGGDCDDTNSSINPNATDIPNNGIDEDCIGGDLITFVDVDGDNFTNDTDCDDNNPSVFPGALEICDNLDNNCDGFIDEGLTFVNYFADIDNDGFGSGIANSLCNDPGLGFSTNSQDCNDQSVNINPNATDIPNNGVDEDCNGSDLNTELITVNDDFSTCIENDLNALVNLLSNDFDSETNIVSSETHTIDLDILTNGIQTEFTSSLPEVTWTFLPEFNVLAVDPGANVEGEISLIYEVCRISSPSICQQGTITVDVLQSTALLTENTFDFDLFPNPVNDYLIIKTNEEIKSVQLYTVDHKKITDVEFNFSIINTNNFTKGMYFIEIQFESGKIKRTNFIKN